MMMVVSRVVAKFVSRHGKALDGNAQQDIISYKRGHESPKWAKKKINLASYHSRLLGPTKRVD